MDLQGAVIQTKDFRSGLLSVPLKAGSEYRLTNNRKLQGNERFAVWDYSEKNGPLVEKLKIGSTILVDYGSVSLKVMGFEDESDFEK